MARLRCNIMYMFVLSLFPGSHQYCVHVRSKVFAPTATRTHAVRERVVTHQRCRPLDHGRPLYICLVSVNCVVMITYTLFFIHASLDAVPQVKSSQIFYFAIKATGPKYTIFIIQVLSIIGVVTNDTSVIPS